MNKKMIVMFAASALLLAACGKLFFWNDLKFTGTLEATEHNVGARVAGRIDKLFVDEGSVVKRGQLIAQLDRYEKASKDYQRARSVAGRGGISDQALEQTELAFEDQQVPSPVDGEVIIKVHEEGEVVQAGAPVAVVADLSKMWVRIFVPEGQISRLKMGQEAKIRFDGLRETFRGKIVFIATKAEFTPRNVQTPEERVTQTFAVKVAVENPGTLRPGVAADVSF